MVHVVTIYCTCGDEHVDDHNYMYFIIIIISDAKGDADEWVEKKRKKDEDSILTKTGGSDYINDTTVW